MTNPLVNISHAHAPINAPGGYPNGMTFMQVPLDPPISVPADTKMTPIDYRTIILHCPEHVWVYRLSLQGVRFEYVGEVIL
jgi:hypothetical protein